MKSLIKNILKEDSTKSPYKFEVGGYLVPCHITEGEIFLTIEEFDKIRKLNNNIKELYGYMKEQLSLQVKHNKGVIYHAIDKIRSKD